MEYKFSDVVLINPKESLKKGAIAKKIAMADIQENYRFIKNFELDKFKSGTKFRNGDTLFARITPCLENGKIAQVNILEENEVAFGSTEFLVLRDKEGVTIPDYVYYLSKWDYIKDSAIKSMTGTSGRQRVQNSIFDELVVDIPSIETQKSIVSALNNLDYKIEINNKIIENLEAQAQAIFKSWFVDFEPFQDGNFVESELGLIPEDWVVKKLGDEINLFTGYPFKSKSYVNDGKYKILTIKNIDDGLLNLNTINKINEIPEKLPTDAFLKIGDVVFTMTGNVGRTSLVHENNILLNQRVGKIVLNNVEHIGYYYFMLRNDLYKNNIINLSHGTAQANLGKKDFLNIPIPYNNKIIDDFSEKSNNMIIEIIKLKQQNSLLSQTRDTLLPKLMSGEIDVSNITIDDEDIDYE